MLDRERANDISLEAVNTTAIHLRRIVALAFTALRQVAEEISDLASYYQDVAVELRHSMGHVPSSKRN